MPGCFLGTLASARSTLDKQTEDEKRMRQFGKVDIPQAAFIEELKMGDN